jgi:hypothetical protein
VVPQVGLHHLRVLDVVHAWPRKPTTVPVPRSTHTVAAGTSIPTSKPITVVQNHVARGMSATVSETCEKPSIEGMPHRGTGRPGQSQERRCFLS